MRFFVGVTDNAWYRFLAERRPEEVNFWRPGGARSFGAVDHGGLFLFKLHAPVNAIAGGGFFVRHAALPLSLAWKCFGEKNGAADVEQVRLLVQAHRSDDEWDPVIGCTILTMPFFWPVDQWIRTPRNWAPNIVQGRGYDTDDPAGRQLWREVLARLGDTVPLAEVRSPPSSRPRNAPRLEGLAIGLGAFRMLVTEAYRRRCAVTGERTLPVLGASHFKPPERSGPNAVVNGVLLRSDLQVLLEHGYLTVTPTMRVEVSSRVRTEFGNGHDYLALHGHGLSALPDVLSDRPDPALLEWHNTHVFRE